MIGIPAVVSFVGVITVSAIRASPLSAMGVETHTITAPSSANNSNSQRQKSAIEQAISNAHRALKALRGDHLAVHDSTGSEIVSARNALYDHSQSALVPLKSIDPRDVERLSEAWQMLYFETRSSLEYYLACGSLAKDERIRAAKASVEDGDRASELIERIVAKRDALSAWVIEDKKADIVRWYQAAAEGLRYEASGDRGAKDAASRYWAMVSPDFRERATPGRSSHLTRVLPSSASVDAE